jgi:uncharacterized protein
MLPALDERTRAFWTGGHQGGLLIEWCPACSVLQNPPLGSCERCGGPVEHRPVSGRGTVFTYTVNSQQFHPDVPPPYVVAIIELAEQPDLRVVGNIVGCDPAAVRIGLAVNVEFEIHGEHAVPVFVLAEVA